MIVSDLGGAEIGRFRIADRNEGGWLEGEMVGKALGMLLHRVEVEDFPLIWREFHWVNEYP